MKLNWKKAAGAMGLLVLAGASMFALAQSGSLSSKLEQRINFFSQRGYIQIQSRSGDLDEGYGRNHYFTLLQGWEYRVVAVCDDDCDDLDLALYDGSERRVDIDDSSDDWPLVGTSPRLSEQYRLRVDMAGCTLEPCGYSLAVLARRR